MFDDEEQLDPSFQAPNPRPLYPMNTPRITPLPPSAVHGIGAVWHIGSFLFFKEPGGCGMGAWGHEGVSVSKVVRSGAARVSFVDIWWMTMLVIVLNCPVKGKREE